MKVLTYTSILSQSFLKKYYFMSILIKNFYQIFINFILFLNNIELINISLFLATFLNFFI